MRGTAALIFCACVQSHTVVKVKQIPQTIFFPRLGRNEKDCFQEKVTSDGWVELILGRLSGEAERSPTVRRRLVYALSCLLRGHSRSQQEFAKAGGFSRLAGLAAEAHSSGDAAMATKATVLLADLAAEEG